MEEFKDIVGYEGLYQVSNYGNVKSLRNNLILKPVGINYKSVVLSVSGKHRRKETLKISRLVAMHFIPNPENKPVVNHIDGNKKNDHYSNLEWNTISENSIHSYKILGNKSPITETTRPLKNIKTAKEYSSIREAARDLRLNPGTLYNKLINNKTDLVFI